MRVATLAASERMLRTVFRTQESVIDLQRQVTSEQRAATYGGLARESGRLLTLEITRFATERTIRNNEIAQTDLDLTASTLEGIEATIQDFRKTLRDQITARPLSTEALDHLQTFAFQSLQAMEGYLNTDANGRFLFAGSQITTRPVDLGPETLEDFQTLYDGAGVVYPPTRDAHIGARGTLGPAETGGLTITGTDTITAGNASAFASLAVGATITLSGSALGNDATYTVVDKPADNVIRIAGTLTAGTATIPVTRAMTNGAEPAASLTIANWYRGDEVDDAHRVDRERTVTANVTAIAPGLEKAIRAMGLVAQGLPGTAGALDQNTGRMDAALALINDAVDPASGGGRPFGAERPGSMKTITLQIGYAQQLLADTNEEQKVLQGRLIEEIAAIEVADQTETIAMLVDTTQALEASYQTLARVRRLSLMDFL